MLAEGKKGLLPGLADHGEIVHAHGPCLTARPRSLLCKMRQVTGSQAVKAAYNKEV